MLRLVVGPEKKLALSSGLPHLNLKSQLAEATHEAAGDLFAVVAEEVVSAEVLVVGIVTDHVVRGREHGRGHRDDRSLRSTASFDAQELGM